MYKKNYTEWSAQTLHLKHKRKQITYNNPVQRANVWLKNKSTKSLLIHTAMTDLFIPPIYANKKDNVFDILDGKQRCYTFIQYLNDEFTLSDDTPSVCLESGEDYEVGGKRFSELPEELMEAIQEFPLMVFYIENASQSVIREIFFRLNNGVALTPTERARAKAMSQELVREIAGHTLLQEAVKAQGTQNYTIEDYVWKSYSALNILNPSFRPKDIRELMATVNISPAEAEELTKCYTRLLDARSYVQNEWKGPKKVLRVIFKGIHLIGLVLAAKRSMDDNLSLEDFSDWIMAFFTVDYGLSVSEEYEIASGNGKFEPENIKIRHRVMMQHYKRFSKGI